MKEKKAVFKKTAFIKATPEKPNRRPVEKAVVDDFKRKQPKIEIGKVLERVKKYYSDTTFLYIY